MQKALQGITVNGEAVTRYLFAQSLKEINEVRTEDKVYVYHPPANFNKAWSPYRGRCSRVRRIAV